MTKALVTGYKGFIGKRLSGKPYIHRLEDYASLFNATEDVTGIIHLASKSNKRSCEADPKECIKSNLLGLCNVLEVALRRKIWVLFISTYQVSEQHLYGLTKLLGEELCRVYQNKGLNVRIARLPIVYGPNDKSDKVVSKFITQLKSGIEPKIDNDKHFNFVYVDDVIKLIEHEVDVLNNQIGKPYTLLNLVDGIREVLREEKK